MAKIIQFNWRRHWSKKASPHLKDEEVQDALDFGMTILDHYWERGDEPYIYGGIGFNRVISGKLSSHQPLGRCHWIAPFAWAIGKKVYPELKWGFLTSDKHTVAVGLDGDEIKIVMDILRFDKMSAEESIAFVKEGKDKLCFRPEEVFVS